MPKTTLRLVEPTPSGPAQVLPARTDQPHQIVSSLTAATACDADLRVKSATYRDLAARLIIYPATSTSRG